MYSTTQDTTHTLDGPIREMGGALSHWAFSPRASPPHHSMRVNSMVYRCGAVCESLLTTSWFSLRTVCTVYTTS